MANWSNKARMLSWWLKVVFTLAWQRCNLMPEQRVTGRILTIEP